MLKWILCEIPLGTFVENRVKEIKTDKDIKFHYISTTENPADKASRGTSTRELRNDRIMWHGLEWLVQPQQTWLEWKRASTDQEEREIQSHTEFEFRKTKVLFEAKLVAGEGSPELKEKSFNIDVEQFLSFTKLCRATAWVIRFIEKLRKRTNLSVHRNLLG